MAIIAGWQGRFFPRLIESFAATLLAVSILLCGLSSGARAQTTLCLNRQVRTLDFRNPVLESGTALAVGAVYRFSNVATRVDARVRIDGLNNGATLSIIDRDTGIIGNFQPELAGVNARSADFTISFVVAGTTTPINFDFAATAIDIDGDSVSLREYAEFSTAFAAFALNNPTNLAQNASGPPLAGNARFEAITAANAPGIDPTAFPNVIQFLYTGQSSFRYRVGTLGTGATVRLTSLDFTCPVLPNPTISNLTVQDFGDAPSSYGNPIHDIVTGVRLGAANTSETGPYNSATASGDSGDDGVTIASGMFQGNPGSATATVVGTGGFLQAWFDWNGNGNFLDAGEQVAINIQDNGTGDTNPATGVIGIGFTVPANAVTTPTFARFRWSLQSGLNANSTIASSGEVEDYQASISPRATLTIAKASVQYSTTGLDRFSIPGSDVLYTITVTNIGPGSTTANSVFVYDALPPQVDFYNADIDGPGPETSPVAISLGTTGLTFTPSTDLRYSNQTTAPASFAACTYTSGIAGYDPAIRYVCLNPKNAMLNGTPSPAISFSFRARIR